MTDIKLNYFRDLSYIFELHGTVKRYIDTGIAMGTKRSLHPDLALLLGEIDKLKGKVKAQLK